MKVNEIPGKLVTTWNAESKAIIDTWSSYSVTLEEFKEAVLVKGLNFAKSRGGIAFIVDSSSAVGVFSQDIQNFIGENVFQAFAQNRIKYFITITSKVSAITKMTVRSYSSKIGPHGVELIELNSVADAIKWLKANS